MTMFGYHGEALHVDLPEPVGIPVLLEEGTLRSGIGGTGLGTGLLLKACEALADSYDPLAPEAPLIVTFSPLVGSPLTTSAKFAIVAKSPLTHRINDSLSSSHFAITGKKTGYDALIVTGRCDRWMCLIIEPGGVRLEDAADLQGLTSRQTEAALASRLGIGFRIASIGPAGECGVHYATISHDGRHAGRGGLGAVMGSKRLKAIAVRGDLQVEFAHPQALQKYAKTLSRKSFGPATAKYRELGTISNLLVFNRLGTLPTRNFQSGTFAAGARLAPEALAGDRPRTRASCAACTIGCEHIFIPADGHGSVRLEYENLYALGPLCGIDDPDVVLRASRLCDDLGIDTISAGVSVAFAMECAERGLIDAPGLCFGAGSALLQTLADIGTRQGLGVVLSLGVRAAAREIGQGAEEFAPHVKGLELPGYDPRALQTMALGFAVGTRGADHNRSGAYEVDFSERVDRLSPGPEAVLAAIETEDQAALMDSLILCKFLRGVFEDRWGAMAEMLYLTAGWEMSTRELREAARGMIDSKKQFNIHQGWRPEEDALPARFFSQPLPEGTSSGAVLERVRFQELIREYNLARGWTAEGYLRHDSRDCRN